MVTYCAASESGMIPPQHRVSSLDRRPHHPDFIEARISLTANHQRVSVASEAASVHKHGVDAVAVYCAQLVADPIVNLD